MRLIITFNNKNWELPEPIVPAEYGGLKFTANTAGSKFNLYCGYGKINLYGLALEYSYDGENWTAMNLNKYGNSDSIVLNNVGDYVYMRGDNEFFTGPNTAAFVYFKGSGSINISGNLLSLLSKKNFESITTLSTNCFYSAFVGCDWLYGGPDITATTIPSNALKSTFTNTHLNYIKCLAQSNYTLNYSSWLTNVQPTGTFVKKAGTNWSSGANGIPTGWTVIEV